MEAIEEMMFTIRQFWTPLRQARLCPNCDAIFDNSYLYCPCCGAQHLYDTVSLLVALNGKEIVNEQGDLRDNTKTMKHLLRIGEERPSAFGWNGYVPERWPVDDFPGFWEITRAAIGSWWRSCKVRWEFTKTDLRSWWKNRKAKDDVSLSGAESGDESDIESGDDA